MGLVIRAGDVKGFSAPYSAFMRLRMLIAAAAHIPLGLMEGYWDASHAYATVFMLEEGGAFSSRMDHLAPIPWAMLATDPLHEFLQHSDCDGVIAHTRAAGVAARLHELKLRACAIAAATEVRPIRLEEWAESIDRLVECFQHAAETHTDVIFG